MLENDNPSDLTKEGELPKEDPTDIAEEENDKIQEAPSNTGTIQEEQTSAKEEATEEEGKTDSKSMEVDEKNETKNQDPEIENLRKQVQRQKAEIERLQKENKEWALNFDSQVEDYRKNQYYRPHSTYDILIKQ